MVEACRRIARAEDHAVFGGLPEAGIVGAGSGSTHEPIPIVDDYSRYPSLVARAVAALREAAVDCPYGIALGPQCYRGVIETTESGGYPVLQHLRLILEGPVVWAPTVDGAGVVSMRGGDFELVSGQDLSIGYASHDADSVTLYVEESMTFRNLAPEAAVALRYG